jgi:membrane-bound inhibitor of C-type lysozyme
MFWFYNRDINGGNTYVRNIHANDNRIIEAKDVKFDTVNSWVYGDVMMESHQSATDTASTIEIKQNVIGLMNESTEDEPNKSSTIYNNSFDEGGHLKINKAYIPGLAYYRFDKKDGATADAPYYFETLESITANSSRLFSEIYDENIGKSTAPLAEYIYSADSDVGPIEVPFNLNPNLSTEYNSDTEIETMLSKAKPGSAFVDDTLDALGTNPNSIANRIKDNVITGIEFEQTEADFDTVDILLKPKIYATGLIVSHLKEGTNYSDTAAALVNRNTQMLTRYNTEKEALKSAYLKKVKSFGFTVDASNSYQYIDDCVDMNSIINQYTPNSPTADSDIVSYLTQSAKTVEVNSTNKNAIIIYAPSAEGETLTLNISRNFEGLVYAKGNVVINYSGNRFMRGTVIATGNVTLNRATSSSHLTFVYDETVIARLINLYTPLKEFFAPYEKGGIEDYELERYRTGMFSGLERFKIIKWQEKMN